MRLGHQLGNRRGIAQAQVQSLRADRRDHMRGLADQRDATATEALRGLNGKRKHAATLLDRYFAEDRMRAALDFGGERWRIKRAQMLRELGLQHAHKA